MRRLPVVVSRALMSAALVAAGVLVGSSVGQTERAVPRTQLPPLDLAAVDADNIYVAVSGYIAGESISAKHPFISTATAVASGVVTSASTTTTGRVSPQSVVITKPVDSYTPQFHKSASSGAHLATVIIWFDRTTGEGEQDIVKLVLSDVLVKQSSLRFNTGGSSTETVTLLVRKQQLTYWPQKQDGSLGTAVVYCWNYATNLSC
jgi:type VI protein secretion system component Hcp